jgi:hypothetical protein
MQAEMPKHSRHTCESGYPVIPGVGWFATGTAYWVIRFRGFDDVRTWSGFILTTLAPVPLGMTTHDALASSENSPFK